METSRPFSPQSSNSPTSGRDMGSPEHHSFHDSPASLSPQLLQQQQQQQSFSNGGALPIKQNHVTRVMLYGVPIVCLFIDGKERLCLAQISNTLLKDFSYNEIHNRRVALGITCVQCTPVQLEILRRAGAMPISSRRCGMITKREAERLVKSFLEDNTPPNLPENFAFDVSHECGWGCKGTFIPSRYNSSRAKCIKCTYCNMFFSPNKFIFHFHRLPEAKYRHPDAANFNSWRRHIKLDSPEASDELLHAWEDVKAMFNGGSRKRLLTPSHSKSSSRNNMDMVKRQRIHHQMENHPMNTMAAGISYPYPIMPMPTTSCPPMPFVPRSTHPAFPFIPPPADHQSMSPDGAKINMADLWKGKPNPYCNPFNMFWAKNLGLSADPSSSYKHPFIEFMRRKEKTSLDIDNNATEINDIDCKLKPTVSICREPDMNWNTDKQSDAESSDDVEKYFSAFTPVGKDGQSFINQGRKNSYSPNKHLSSSRTDDKMWCDRMSDGSDSPTPDCDESGVDDVINVTDVDHEIRQGKSPVPESHSLQSKVEVEKEPSTKNDKNVIPVEVQVATHEQTVDTRDTQKTGAECGTSGSGSRSRPTLAHSIDFLRGVQQSKTLNDSKKIDVTGSSEVTAERKISSSTVRGEAEEKMEKKKKCADGSESQTKRDDGPVDGIYSMTKEELQKELLRMIQARHEAEEEYKAIKDSFQEEEQQGPAAQEEMEQRLHLVKEAHDALDQFSSKMLALRQIMNCKNLSVSTG